jgi:hypothetical protein
MVETMKTGPAERQHLPFPAAALRCDPLRRRLANVMAACNSARRLEALGGLTPCECIREIGTSGPVRPILDPTHRMRGAIRAIAVVITPAG